MITTKFIRKTTDSTTSYASVNNAVFLWRIIDLVYPPFCCHCGQLGSELCSSCFSSIEWINPSDYCPKCGLRSHPSGNCNANGLFFQEIRSWGIYTGALRSIVQKLKYHRGVGLVPYILPALVDYVRNWHPHVDVVVPLPLGHKREHQRGYNQTALFAKPLAKNIGLGYLPKSVERTRETISQVGLTARERKVNMMGAFKANTKIVRGLNILLIDDITTTGSTINECAKSLIMAGAESVSCFTLAKAKIKF